MVLLIFIFGVLLALGLFFIMADLLKLPRLATQRAMLSVGRQEKKQARSGGPAHGVGGQAGSAYPHG